VVQFHRHFCEFSNTREGAKPTADRMLTMGDGAAHLPAPA